MNAETLFKFQDSIYLTEEDGQDRQIEIYRQTDRETDRLTDRLTDRQIDRQTD